MLGEQLLIDGDVLFSHDGPNLGRTGAKTDKRDAKNRVTVNVPVKLRPANTSQRSLHELHGRTKDFSITGCGLILNNPPYVGDIYRFESMEGNDALLMGVLGRCVRCHLIDEDVFEAGFQFLTPLPHESLSNGLF